MWAMEPINALMQRRSKPLTPYIADNWHTALKHANLLCKYPSLSKGLHSGFVIGLPIITSTITPSNSTTLSTHLQPFLDLIRHEFDTGRYIGPFSRAQLEDFIGPFQTSPLSMIPKPHKPDSFRIIQNFSFPHTPRPGHVSINSQVDSDCFPATWCTFNIFSLLVSQLPVGTEAMVRDIAEAFRTVPLDPSQ